MLRFNKILLLFFGIFLTQFYPVIGLPLSVILLLLTTKIVRLDRWRMALLLLLILKISWMLLIQITIGNLEAYTIATSIGVDIILITSLFCRIDNIQFSSFLRFCILLFFIDLFFNVSSLLGGGIDILGRHSAKRFGDNIIRFGGVFNHPFASINISIIGLFSSLLLKKRLFICIAFFALIFTGSQRGPLSALLIFLLLMFFNKKHQLWHTYLFSILFCFFVFFGIILFESYWFSQFNTESAHTFRIFAWKNAIYQIIENPLLGAHDFSFYKFESISRDIILDNGITESKYLKLWVHYGIVAPFASLFILVKILNRRLRIYKKNPFSLNKILAIIICFSFIDQFYGSFYGAIYPTFFVCLCCVCFDYKKINSY